MAMATVLSSSLPHLLPCRATSFPSAAVAVSLSVPSRTARQRESRLAAAAPAASKVLESTNGAIPTAAMGGIGCRYGREYLPLAAVVEQVRNYGAALPASWGSFYVICGGCQVHSVDCGGDLSRSGSIGSCTSLGGDFCDGGFGRNAGFVAYGLGMLSIDEFLMCGRRLLSLYI